MRGIQSGYLRYYAALLLIGSHRPERLLPDLRMIHLTILVFFPAVCGLLAAFNPRVIGLIATLIPLVYAVMMVADFDTAGGLQHVTDDAWIPELGIRYSLGVDGLNLWLILLATVIAFACAVWLAGAPRRGASRAVRVPHGARRDRGARRVRARRT